MHSVARMKRGIEQGVSRRGFLRGVGGGGVALLGSGAALSLLGGCPADDPNTSYTTHQKETMEALADTVIPGSYYAGGYLYVSDPEAGGAVQAGAWNLYWDTYYGLNGWIDECVDDLGSDFKYQSLSTRAWILQDKLNGNNGPWYATGEYTPIYKGAITLAKLAFFGGVVNNVGTSYIGFPGPAEFYAAELTEPYP